jgi:hypothetical protein
MKRNLRSMAIAVGLSAALGGGMAMAGDNDAHTVGVRADSFCALHVVGGDPRIELDAAWDFDTNADSTEWARFQSDQSTVLRYASNHDAGRKITMGAEWGSPGTAMTYDLFVQARNQQVIYGPAGNMGTPYGSLIHINQITGTGVARDLITGILPVAAQADLHYRAAFEISDGDTEQAWVVTYTIVAP